MIDRDMMEEVLRWMAEREGPELEAEEAASQVEESLTEASIDPEAIAYYSQVIPEDIMRSSAQMRPPGEDPVQTVQLALASTFTVAFEAGSRCRALDMERNG
jgi:hypothetical protein